MWEGGIYIYSTLRVLNNYPIFRLAIMILILFSYPYIVIGKGQNLGTVL